jgi:dGTPase
MQTQNDAFESDLLKNTVKLEPEFAAILQALKIFVYERLIREPKMQQIEFSGQNLLMDLFKAFASDPMRLLPYTTQDILKEAKDESARMRALTDYLSGMSDEYARKIHARLFAGVN